MRQVLRLMVALFLLMIVTRLATKGTAATLASRKAYDTKQRFDAAYSVMMPAAASMAPITSSGNAAYLAGLTTLTGVAPWPTFGGSPTLAELTADVQNGVSVYNGLVSALAAHGFA